MKTANEIKTYNERYGNWQPQIRMFSCERAGGGAAFDYEAPEEFVSELVPCAGMIDTSRLVKAFEGGVDAVCIVACPPDDCETMEGSLRATRRTMAVRKLLDEIGIGGDRIEVIQPGASAEALDEAVQSFLNRVWAMGPSTLNLVNA